MQVITKYIEYQKPDVFNFWPLGDIHTGVIHCDEDLFENEVAEVRKDPKHNYWLGIGDYADLILPSDFKRWDGRILAPWMQKAIDNIGPTQLERVDDLLSPIWKQCLGLIEGNHDDGIRRHNHYDFMAELLKKANKGIKKPEEYNIPYAGVSCFVRLIFKRRNSTESHEFVIHARHGEGAARTSGARAMAVLRLSQSMVNAHITWMGHLHGQESPDIPERIVCRNGMIKDFPTIATMTGAWLKAYMQDVPPCYLERWGTPPSTLGCPIVSIKPDTGEIILKKSRKARPLDS